jgi:peroxiredoxin
MISARDMRTFLTAVLFLAPVGAQANEAAIAEIRELLTKKVNGFEEMKARGDAVVAWSRNNTETDLGEYSFLLPLCAYFARDYDAAATGLDAYLAKHQKFPTKEFDTIIGRTYLNVVMEAVKKGDIPAAEKACNRALEFYDKPGTIYMGACRNLHGAGTKEALQLANQLTAKLLNDERVDDAERLAVLKTVHGVGRGAAAAGGGVAVARPAPAGELKPFTAQDLEGKPIALSDYKGKVVLVDFWATWCGPCLREMPNVVAAYEKFKNKGFDVIGISLDRPDAEDKIRAMQERFGMPWRQIYDGGYWQARLAVENGIRSIPATFLVDREGKLRYTNLRGEQLMQRVAELIEQKPVGR